MLSYALSQAVVGLVVLHDLIMENHLYKYSFIFSYFKSTPPHTHTHIKALIVKYSWVLFTVIDNTVPSD